MDTDSQFDVDRTDSDSDGETSDTNETIAVENWQSTTATVKKRLLFLVNNEILSDVHFNVGKGKRQKRIFAHKFVLAMRSEVFDVMFNGKLAIEGDIELPDVDPKAFLAFLKFLYSDKVTLAPDTAMTVLYTAKKYIVPALEEHCIDFLKNNLCANNAFELLKQSRMFDVPKLEAFCLDTIDRNTEKAVLRDGFLEIDLDTLCLVLERDTLRIKEANLFKAVVRWGKAECKRQSLTGIPANCRQMLGRSLTLIRFPVMTCEEFAEGPALSELLTKEEVNQMFLYFTVNPKPATNFPDTPRQPRLAVNRFQDVEWLHKDVDPYERATSQFGFVVDSRIFLEGFGILGSMRDRFVHNISIEITKRDTEKVCAKNDTCYQSYGPKEMYFVMFKEPVEILPDISYDVKSDLEVCAKNDTCYQSYGPKEVYHVMFKEPVEILPDISYDVKSALKGRRSHHGTGIQKKVVVQCSRDEDITFLFTNIKDLDNDHIKEILFRV